MSNIFSVNCKLCKKEIGYFDGQFIVRKWNKVNNVKDYMINIFTQSEKVYHVECFNHADFTGEVNEGF